ncbi:NAD(+) diphosphatase [Nocardioides lentus]|uniref:NAD(+) diphosphatase n=1 Tax=Nocardioides lentus TaxID=338077 RepID=A0ABP5B770_9ACTN
MAHPHESISLDPHDRQGVHRRDRAWLDARWEDPATRVLAVAGGRARRTGRDEGGGPAWVAPGEAPDGHRVLLGERDGTTYAAVLLDPSAVAEDDRSWASLRELLPAVEGHPDAPLVLHAVGIAEWVAVTRFCPRCGAGLELEAAGHELACPRCGRRQFPRTDAAVIMLVRHGEPGSAEERCLLGRQAAWPEGRFSTLAGFYEPGETLEDTVRREVAEETGVRVGQVEYFGNQPWPLPASLMIGMLAEAVTTEIVRVDDELEDARWFTRAEMAEQAASGELVLPGGISISRSLVEHWYGAPLPGSW